MEKDRARRYDSADALAEDIRHFLANKPVSASPPKVLYTLRKFGRRQPVALAVAAVLMVMLIVAFTPVTRIFFQGKSVPPLADNGLAAALEIRLGIAEQKFLVEENRRRLGMMPDIPTLEQRYRWADNVWQLGDMSQSWQQGLTESNLNELGALLEWASWLPGSMVRYGELALRYKKRIYHRKILSTRHAHSTPRLYNARKNRFPSMKAPKVKQADFMRRFAPSGIISGIP